MKIATAIFADFAETFLGGPPRLTTPLAGRAVLAHTLERLSRIQGVEHRCLVVRPRDEAVAREMLRGFQSPCGGRGDRSPGREAESVELLAIDSGERPRRRLMRSARVWNLDGWRGTPMGSTWFDEFIEPFAVGRVLDHTGCDAVLGVDGHQAALDPAICTRIVAHQRANRDEAPYVFTQAPPGLAGIVLTRGATRQLLEERWPVGLLMSFRPEIPKIDPITKPPCLRLPAQIAQTAGRWLADTRCGFERLRAAFGVLGADCDAAALCAWQGSIADAERASLPVEIELEITTDDPLPETTLRPRGRRAPRRVLDDPAAVGRLGRQLAEFDDRRVVLCGHGDPLRHPAFGEVCRELRAAGVAGIGVTTPLVELSDEQILALVEHRVDLVEVQLDANCAATYRQVHQADEFELVLANVDRLRAARETHQSPQPLVVCSLTRCAATVGEVEGFFERWIRATGSAVIRGYNDFAGEMPADALPNMTPLIRSACRRLANRMTLLADGRVTVCEQDFAGRGGFGDWRRDDLTNLWASASLATVREGHSRESWNGLPLCGACGEWSRY